MAKYIRITHYFPTFTLESTITAGDFTGIVSFGIPTDSNDEKQEKPEKKNKKKHSKRDKRKRNNDNIVRKNIVEAIGDDKNIDVSIKYNVELVTIQDLIDTVTDLIEQYKSIYIYLPSTVSEEFSLISNNSLITSDLFDKHKIYNTIRKLTRYKEYLVKNFDNDYYINAKQLEEFVSSIVDDVTTLSKIVAAINVADTLAYKELIKKLKTLQMHTFDNKPVPTFRF